MTARLLYPVIRPLKRIVGLCAFDECYHIARTRGGICVGCWEELKPSIVELADLMGLSLEELAQVTLNALKSPKRTKRDLTPASETSIHPEVL